VKDLILDALRESVKSYPDIIEHLRGGARWIAEVYTYKVGEAPDDDVRRRDERRLELRLREFLAGQLERIVKELKKEFKAMQPSFWEDELSKMWDELGQDFVGIILHGAYGGLNLLPDSGERTDIDDLNMQLARWGRTYRDQWLSKIEQTSRKYVEEQITQWQLSGDPLSTLIKAMSADQGGMFSKLRASRIAVTEVTRLHAMGNQMAWEQAGDVKQFQWMTSEDEKVCKRCLEGNQGSPYPLNQLHELIPAHVNCRCWAQPIVDISNLEEEIRQSLGIEGELPLDIQNYLVDKGKIGVQDYASEGWNTFTDNEKREIIELLNKTEQYNIKLRGIYKGDFDEEDKDTGALTTIFDDDTGVIKINKLMTEKRILDSHNQWVIAGRNFGEIVSHELGHIYSEQYTDESIINIFDHFARFMSGSISRYAASDPYELIAECFTVVINNIGDRDIKLARQILERLIRK